MKKQNIKNMIAIGICLLLNNIILEKTRAGEKVCIQGFGVYTPRLQTSRLARNPKSGETLMLIPRTIVHFKCAPNLVKEINK